MTERNRLAVLAAALRTRVPGLCWRPRGRLARHGTVGVPGYRLRLVRRGHFVWLVCQGFVAADPRLLVDMTSGMCGPARMVQRRPSGRPFLAACWPVRLSAEHQAKLLAADLRWILGAEPGSPSPLPVAESVRQHLKNVASADARIAEVPSTGRSWDFMTGRRAGAMQLRAWQPNENAVALNTLVTNWRAEGQTARCATAAVMLMLNARLRWVRLVLRDTAIEAEVTLPVSAVTQEAWRLARQALGQAVASCRETLRLIQAPEVAAAFEHVHPPGIVENTRCDAERGGADGQVVVDERSNRSAATDTA